MKKNTLQKLLGIGAVSTAFAISGCANMGGGGWMYSAGQDLGDLEVAELVGEEEKMAKATFGFEFTCEDNSVQGHLTYHDHGSTYVAANGKVKKVAFQATIPPTPVAGCVDTNAYATYYGEYTPIPPKAGDPGYFTFSATDGGETGPDKMDTVSITLDEGVLDGYSNSGMTGGGNITLP